MKKNIPSIYKTFVQFYQVTSYSFVYIRLNLYIKYYCILFFSNFHLHREYDLPSGTLVYEAVRLCWLYRSKWILHKLSSHPTSPVIKSIKSRASRERNFVELSYLILENRSNYFEYDIFFASFHPSCQTFHRDIRPRGYYNI